MIFNHYFVNLIDFFLNFMLILIHTFLFINPYFLFLIILYLINFINLNFK